MKNNEFDHVREISLRNIAKLLEKNKPAEETKALSVRLPMSLHNQMNDLATRYNVSAALITKMAMEVGLASMSEQTKDDESLKDREVK